MSIYSVLKLVRFKWFWSTTFIYIRIYYFRLCKVKIIYCGYNNVQTTQTIVSHALICNSFFDKENNHQILLSCPWCTALFFLWNFSPKESVCGDQDLGSYMLVGHVPPSVDTIGCFPWILISWQKSLATNIFRSLEIVSARISLLSGSIAIQSQICSYPTLIKASSTIYS